MYIPGNNHYYHTNQNNTQQEKGRERKPLLLTVIHGYLQTQYQSYATFVRKLLIKHILKQQSHLLEERRLDIFNSRTNLIFSSVVLNCYLNFYLLRILLLRLFVTHGILFVMLKNRAITPSWKRHVECKQISCDYIFPCNIFSYL